MNRPRRRLLALGAQHAETFHFNYTLLGQPCGMLKRSELRRLQRPCRSRERRQVKRTISVDPIAIEKRSGVEEWGSFSDIAKITQDTKYVELSNNAKRDQGALLGVLQSCGEPSTDTGFSRQSLDDFITNITTGDSSSTPSADQFSAPKIDAKAVCKPFAPDPTSLFQIVEGDAPFHKAKITPLAEALGADIKKLNDYQTQFEKTQSDKRGGVITAADKLSNNIKYSFDNIVMTDKNSDTGAVNCKATVAGHLDGYDDVKKEITYLIEKTSKGDFEATVQGL